MTDNTVVAAIKGFDRDLTCRGFQYRVGETYTTDVEPVLCKIGFHACTMPIDTWTYYAPCTSAYGDVALSGALDSAHDGDSKIACASITIRAELQLPEIISRAVRWILERAKDNTATGDYGHAAATGDYGHAAAAGYRGHAAATGDYGHAAAAGYRGHAAATGYRGHAAATGYRGHAAATGSGGHAAATGDGGHAAATSYRGHAAATGSGGHAAATGYRGHAAATGSGGHAAVAGQNAIAAALGQSATAQAGPDGWIVLSAWRRGQIVTVRAAKVGGPEGVRPGVTYRLTETGEFVEAAT